MAVTAAVSPRSFPSPPRAIRSQQGGRPFVPAHDDLQEVFGRGVRQLAHPEVVDDKQRHGGDVGDVLLAGAGELGLGEVFEEDVGLAIQDAVALLDHGEADRLRQVALAGAGRNSHILRSFHAPSSSITPGIRSSARR